MQVEILKFDSAPRASRGKSKSTAKPLFAIVGMVALAALGTTLAGQITMNSGQAVEFGQGVSVTASCDVTGGITLAPSATFINAASGTGTFSLGTIGFSGIDSACANKVFTLKAYDNTAGSSPLVLATTGSGSVTTWNYATFAFSAGNTAKSGNINTGNHSAGNGSNGTIDVGFLDSRTVLATNVFKFTLESSAS
jgi:hypothetical protein